MDTTLAVANSAAAGVQESRTALAGLDGQQGHLGVKAQVTKDDKVYAAGMSLGAYTNPDGRVQSSVYFLADRFGFLSLANGAVTTPFVIENGQTVINDAVIGTGGSRMR